MSGVTRPALAVRGRDQALPAPLLDLPARPRPLPSAPERSLTSTPATGRASAYHPGDYVVCADEMPRSRPGRASPSGSPPHPTTVRRSSANTSAGTRSARRKLTHQAEVRDGE
jgi:hypothetical protein